MLASLDELKLTAQELDDLNPDAAPEVPVEENPIAEETPTEDQPVQ